MAQHPVFIEYSKAFRSGEFERALELADSLVAAMPDSAPLAWHRANCLEQLERFDELLLELNRLLDLSPDYAPAIIKRVRYAAAMDGEDETFEGEDDAAWGEGTGHAQHEAEMAAAAMEISMEQEAELRRALALQPDNVDGLELLSGVLRYREGTESLKEEADSLLDRAIELAPERADLLETRAGIHRSDAMLTDDAAGDVPVIDIVTTYTGIRYRRSLLQAALDDHERCLALTGEYRHAVRMGGLLHDLQRFDEALARYDEALEMITQDDPVRPHILDMRRRSENQGAGEREQIARIIEAAVEDDGDDRTQEEDFAAQAMLGAAQAIRSGKTVEEAIEARISDDPDTLVAMNIAQQILNVANEMPPDLQAVVATDYPAYQRRFASGVSRQADKLDLRHVGDAEAAGLFSTLGQHLMIRFFADESAEVGVAAFSMRPKWPGLLGFLVMFLTGKWKTHSMIECVTQFEDGTHLSTQTESISPFEYAGAVRIEKLPARATLGELLSHHLQRVWEYKEEHPEAVAIQATDIAGMDHRWRESQKAKRAYRESIGYVTDEELKRMLGDQYQRFADKVREHLAVLAEDMHYAH
ncbi:MAG: hypothetical protein KDJ14_11210 [Xanthomonadales bacterium]|nr:hypothetical protein [Xanthomonadales bacterium]